MSTRTVELRGRASPEEKAEATTAAETLGIRIGDLVREATAGAVARAKVGNGDLAEALAMIREEPEWSDYSRRVVRGEMELDQALTDCGAIVAARWRRESARAAHLQRTLRGQNGLPGLEEVADET